MQIGSRGILQRQSTARVPGDTAEPIFTSEPLSGLRHLQTLITTQERLHVGAGGRIYAFSL
jgi:hypothetical protein